MEKKKMPLIHRFRVRSKNKKLIITRRGLKPHKTITMSEIQSEENPTNNSGDETDTSLPPNGNEAVTASTSEVSEPWECKCIFCGQDLKDLHEPKLLQCLHTACNSCLISEAENGEASTSTDLGKNQVASRRTRKKSVTGNKQLQCPVCNQDINFNEAIDHLFLLEHLTQSSDNAPEESKSYVCTSCEEGADAAGFCSECQEWLCDTCVDAHHRVRITKDHVIRRKEEMEGEKQLTGLSQKYLFCQTHNQEQLKLYCETCDKLTCRDCQLSDHKEHKYQFLSKACEEEKNCIQSLLAKIKDKQQHIDSACELVNKRNGEITEREQAVSQEIKNFAVKYISEINKRGKQLLQDLSDVCVQKKTQLSFKHNELITVGQKLEYCMKFAEMALIEGSETALVYSKKLITNQLRRILKHRCEVPNPQHLVDITFSFEPNYLTQYISHHGTLLVDQHPVPQPTNVAPLPNQNQALVPHQQQQMPQQMQRGQMQQPMQQNVRQNQMLSPMRQNMQQQMVAINPRNNNGQIIQQQMTPNKQMQLQKMATHGGHNVFGQPQVTSSTDHTGKTVRQMLTANQPQNNIGMRDYSRNPMQRAPNSINAVRNNFNNGQYIQQSPQRASAGMVAQTIRSQQPQQRQAVQQQQQRPQPQQPVQQQSVPQPQPVQLSMLNNRNITISAVPTISTGPTPPKQRAITPRQNVQLTPTPNQQINNRVVPRASPQSSQQSSPQLIVLDNDGPNKMKNTLTMSTTNRLSHFPAANATAASVMNAHPSLQIQPLNPTNNQSKF